MDLKNRTDSITPPYPSFGEFIRSLLDEGYTAKDIADSIRDNDDKAVSEELVNKWASDASPQYNIRPGIQRAFGYDFVERSFYEAAIETGFPGENPPQEIAEIRTVSALRQYMKKLLQDGIIMARLVEFFGMHSKVLRNLVEKSGLSKESFVYVLHRLPVVPLHVDGTFLSDLTPVDIIAKCVFECRISSGMGKKEYAERLGIDVAYLQYLEERLHRKPTERTAPAKGGVHTPERMQKLCTRLMAERNRLAGKETAATQPEPEQEQATESVPVREKDARPVPARETDPAEQRLRNIERRLYELERRLDSDGTKKPMANPPAAGSPTTEQTHADGYRSPFTPERWHEHDASADNAFIRVAETLVIQVCESLGYLAQVRDPQRRGAIRARFAPLMTELLCAAEGFSQEYPNAALKILESWREWGGRFNNENKE